MTEFFFNLSLGISFPRLSFFHDTPGYECVLCAGTRDKFLRAKQTVIKDDHKYVVFVCTVACLLSRPDILSGVKYKWYILRCWIRINVVFRGMNHMNLRYKPLDFEVFEHKKTHSRRRHAHHLRWLPVEGSPLGDYFLQNWSKLKILM